MCVCIYIYIHIYIFFQLELNGSLLLKVVVSLFFSLMTHMALAMRL